MKGPSPFATYVGLDRCLCSWLSMLIVNNNIQHK
jgi:hypothetical protein